MMEKFLSWISNHSCSFSSTKVKNLPNFGNSLIASRKIAKNEIILSIDESIFITIDSVAKDELITQIRSKIFLSKKSSFALFLWKEITKKTSSFWYLYFSIVPKYYSNTIVWNENDYDGILRKDLIQQINEKQLLFKSEFEKIKEFWGSNKDAKQYEFIENLTYPRFLNLIGFIESRTLFYPSSNDAKSEVGALVPYYDFCNHSFLRFDIYNFFFFDKKERKYILKAYKDFEFDEQIFISYGNYNNLHFVEYYGFIPYDNVKNDFIVIRLGLKDFLDANEDIKCLFRKNLDQKKLIIKTLFPNLMPSLKNDLSFEMELEIERKGSKSCFRWQDSLFFSIFCLKEKKVESLIGKETNFFDFNKEDFLNTCNWDYDPFQLLMEICNYIKAALFPQNNDKGAKMAEQNSFIHKIASEYGEYEKDLIRVFNPNFLEEMS